jgi:hypothetical protein
MTHPEPLDAFEAATAAMALLAQHLPAEIDARCEVERAIDSLAVALAAMAKGCNFRVSGTSTGEALILAARARDAASVPVLGVAR